MHGWTGKTVTIDLADSKVIEAKSDPVILHLFIGGRGLGVKLYCDAIEPDIDPLSPENILIFATGPLTGTAAPMSGRHVMVSKSPLTGTIFDSSSGGFFGKELKFAGIDALIIKGIAQEPVYISIENDQIDIHPAKGLWGENVRSCTEKLSPKGRVACIGRAGERLVPMANVMNDYFHACGRGGLGAVMGSKNLKAVVVKGDKKPGIADEEGFRKARDDAMRLIKAGPVASKGLSTYGTSALLSLTNHIKILPAANFRKNEFSGADKVSGEFIKENYDVKSRSCYNCIIACKHIIKSGELEGHEIPEYETLWAFGPDNNNNDMDEIIKANRLCNDYGIDTISSGSTIAACAEIMGEDIKELSGLVKKIGESEGIGKELGMGSKALPGKKDAAMHTKGLELPGYDPRGVLGMALAYATSNRGGGHVRAYMIAPEVLGKPKKIDRLTFSGKAGLVQFFQNEMAALDSLVLCLFASFAVAEGEFASLLRTATGVDYSTEEFLKCGERIWNLERLFNIRAGFSRKDDTLTERFFKSGGIERAGFEKALDEYYQFRGWDGNGMPTEKKQRELGLIK